MHLVEENILLVIIPRKANSNDFTYHKAIIVEGILRRIKNGEYQEELIQEEEKTYQIKENVFNRKVYVTSEKAPAKSWL